MLQNPFLDYGGVAHGDRFIGREHAVDMVRQVAMGSSIAIVGLPKVGKSSLLEQALMQGEARLLEQRVLPVWVNVPQHPTGVELMRAFVSRAMVRLEHLVEDAASIQAAARTVLEPAPTWSEMMHNLEMFFGVTRTLSWRIVFVLDDFDAALRLYNQERRVFQGLRELATNPRCNLGLATTSRRSIAQIEDETVGSCLSEVLHKYRVPLFTEPECERLLQLLICAGIELTDDLRRRAVEMTGGHPYLLNRLCYEVAAQVKAGDPLDLDRACGFRGAGESFAEHYRVLEGFLRSVDLYDKLLEVVVGPQVSVSRMHVDALLAYGLIRPAETGEYVPFSAHYHDYLRGQSHLVDLWPIWGETERAVRTILLREFTSRYGDEWPNTLGKANPGVAEIVERCRQRHEYEGGTRNRHEAGNLLDYTDPSDLWPLLRCEWGLFAPTFKRDRSYWGARFNDVLPVRRAMAHSRPLVSTPERMRAEAACREILSCLGRTVG